MARQAFQGSVEAVVDENDAEVFFYAGPLDEDSWRQFVAVCPDEIGRPNAVLYLTTYGGDPASAYRITRCLQRKFASGKITVVVDSMCKSAGTLIAVGAGTIAMSDCGELGPLDVQIGQQDEVFGFQSGLVAVQALETLQEQSFSYFEEGFLTLTSKSRGRITTRTAAELASNLAGTLFGQLYAQLDPMRLGENYRQMLVSREYARRLAGTVEVPQWIRTLIAAYPSHGFVIDREEAAALFPDVRAISERELALAGYLEKVAHSALTNYAPIVEHLNGDPTGIAAKFGLSNMEETTDVETTVSKNEATFPTDSGIGEDAAREFSIDGIGDRESTVAQ